MPKLAYQDVELFNDPSLRESRVNLLMNKRNGQGRGGPEILGRAVRGGAAAAGANAPGRHLCATLYVMAIICLKRGTRETFLEGDGHFKRAQASHARCLYVHGRPHSKGIVSPPWPNPPNTIAHFVIEFAREMHGATNGKDVQQLKRKHARLDQSFLPEEVVQ